MSPSSNTRLSSLYVMARNDSTNIYNESKEMASYVVKKTLGENQRGNKNGNKMYELCLDMKLKHEPFFDGINNRLCMTASNIEEVSKSVMEEILADGCNHGRIVSVFTFCMVIAEICSKCPELRGKIDSIVEITADIMHQHIHWFEENGNWDDFIDFFATPSDKLWKGLMITTVGLGAVAGLLYANS